MARLRLRFPVAVLPVPVAVLSALTLSAGMASADTTVPTSKVPRSRSPVPTVARPRIRLAVEGAGGNPLFAVTGRRILLHGAVAPYAPGQTLKVVVYRDGRRVQTSTQRVFLKGRNSGQFSLWYSSSSAGVVQAYAVHYATSQLGAFSGRSEEVRFASPDLRPGARGASVHLLQSELSALHYAVPSNGDFDEATAQAVIAFRKLTGLVRVASTNTGLFELLQHGAGSFRVRYPNDGRHVEADLSSQVLAEIERGGRVRSIYEISSGKPSTPTVIGRFRVYLKTPGVNSEGMVDSNYFIAGYAIHGYPEVPIYAASHGCLRVPIPDAAPIYSWVRLGTPVEVYNEGGGGSRNVSGRAGP